MPKSLPQVARLFRAAAEAETVHAHNHLRVMGGVKKTAENLAAAIKGETYEFTKMYPVFIAEAGKEKNGEAEMSFTFANRVEKIHAGLYQKAAASVATGKDLPATVMHVCQVCGNTVEGNAPDACPICGAPRVKFKKVD